MLQKPFFFLNFIFQGISIDNEQNLAWELDKNLLSIIFQPHISENDHNKSCTDLVTRSLSLGVVKNCSYYSKIFFRKARENLNREIVSCFSGVVSPVLSYSRLKYISEFQRLSLR